MARTARGEPTVSPLSPVVAGLLAVAMTATGCVGIPGSDPPLPEPVGVWVDDCRILSTTNEALDDPQRLLFYDTNDWESVNLDFVSDLSRCGEQAVAEETAIIFGSDPLATAGFTPVGEACGRTVAFRDRIASSYPADHPTTIEILSALMGTCADNIPAVESAKEASGIQSDAHDLPTSSTSTPAEDIQADRALTRLEIEGGFGDDEAFFLTFVSNEYPRHDLVVAASPASPTCDTSGPSEGQRLVLYIEEPPQDLVESCRNASVPVQATLIAERHVVFAVSSKTFGATPCLNADQLFALLELGTEQLTWASLVSTTLPLASDLPPEIRLPAQTEPIHLALETATPRGRLAPDLPVLDSPVARMQAALDNNAIIAPVPIGTVLPDGLVTAEAEVDGLCTNAGTAEYPFRYSLGVLAIGDSSVAAIEGSNDLGDPEEYGLVRAHPPTEQR